MNNAFFSLILTAFLLSAISSAQPGPGRGHGPQLTDTQRSCLESKIGAPGSGNRPSREEMDAAMSACGIERPAPPDQSSSSSSSNSSSNWSTPKVERSSAGTAR